MKSSATSSYLETEVLTATPQKLQLMLIDGAIRFVGRARHFWQAGQDEEASEALIRAQQIVTELLAGLNRRVDPALTGRVASVYLFVFRSLVEANLHRDEDRLAGAIEVLEVERQTWSRLCETLGSDAESGGPSDASRCRAHPGAPLPGSPKLPSGSAPAGDPPSGLSLEA